jgi:predicted AlkP superfamily phosphohydrolase/phosphomutase/tetratricopeptide (TPR) repeat protein
MSKRLTKRVLLIGWDAADWHIINPLIEAGKMPVLEKLIEAGVSGKIATLQPVISPILWNSLATGKYADKHGILDFVEPIPDGRGIRAVNSTSRRAKALWNILSQNGMRSGVVNWYASQPAEPINGTVFTSRFVSILPEEPGKVPLHPRSVHPPELREIAEDFRVHPADLSLQQALAFFPEAKPSDLKDPRLDALAKMLAECATTHNAATYLAARDDWDFLALYYDAIDHAGHQFMEYHPPAMAHVGAEDAALYGGMITCMYRFHDMLLRRLLDLVGPETTVILVSDHGFYSDHLRPYVREHSRDPAAKISIERNPTSWHRPHGIFVAAGQGIKRDELIHGATLLDIAPTILTLLGLPVADDMDGKVLTRILQESVEPERIDSYEPPHPNDGMHRDLPADDTDPWAARQALLQLAELGYITLPADGNVTKMVNDADWDRRSNLAQVYFSTGRMTEALELLRELLVQDERPHLRCRIALCLVALGRPAEAEEVIESVSPEEAGSPLPRLIHGQIRLAQGRIEEAIAMLEPLQTERLPLSHLHTVLGQAYLRRGLLDEAEAAFRQAVEREDENAEAHDGLGVVLRRRGLYEDSTYEHMRSAALLHHRPMTHIHLGMTLTRSGHYEWAIRAFEIAVELAPNLPFPHRCLVHLYRRDQKNEAKAGEHLRRLLELRRARREAAALDAKTETP